MTSTHELKRPSDDELLRHLAELVQRSRRVEAVLVAHLAEVDERRLYIREAPSMFAYCTQYCTSRSTRRTRASPPHAHRGGIRCSLRC
jgi:hypothetical protein